MKTKRTNRLVSLVLAIVMLASVVTLPVFAEEEKEGLVFANVDFESAEVNQVEELPEGAEPGTGTLVPGTSITDKWLKGAHPYVSLGEDEEHGKYAIIPFRGIHDGTTTGGNYDKTLTINHPEVSYATTQGVNIEFDLYAEHHPLEGESDPTVEFQLQSINHDAIGTNNSTSWVTFGQLNLRTGEFGLTSVVKSGAKGVVIGQWNKIRFEMDLANASFKIYINDVLYGDYGTIGGGASNIVIPAGKLLIAKCNKSKNAYADKDAEGNTIPDAELTHVAIDNIKFYENTEFVPPIVEEKPAYALFYDSYQTRTMGVSPKTFGYPTVPSTALVSADPVNAGNSAIKVDFAAKSPAKYYLWFSANNTREEIAPNEDYNPEDPTNFPEYTIVDGKLTAKTSKGTFTAPIWGDDPSETLAYDKIPSSYAISELAGVQHGNKSGTWYFVTGEMCDAYHGGGNVGVGLNVKHPAISSADSDTIVLNVDYFFSEDSKGKIEIQMNGFFHKKDNPVDKSKSMWIDTVQIEAKENNDNLTVGTGSNYVLVCGSAPLLKKGEWFTMSVVLNMKTGWEDIYFNGSYAYTMQPKAEYTFGTTAVSIDLIEFDSIGQNTLSVGKIVRNTRPNALAGYYMIDNVNFSTGEVLLGEQYEKNYVENFDEFTVGTTDFTNTNFANNIPGSIVLAGDDTHATALKMTMGEPLDEAVASAPVLFRVQKDATSNQMHRIAKVYDDGDYVLLEADVPAGGEIPETAPDNAIAASRTGKYKVGEVSGYILGTYGDYVNYWGVLDANNTPSTNVDRQWTFRNPGISYAIKERVATDVEIFIPADASGIVSSQIIKGAGTNSNGTKANFSYLDLYCIDLATGNINLGATVSNKDTEKLGQLNVGEWNNVSYAVNMVTGVAELYVNNVFVGEGSIGYTDVAFYENNWILAKVARKQDPEDHPLRGYFMIDDARFFTVTNQMITVDPSMENVIEVNFHGEQVADGTKLFITEDVRCTCEVIDEDHACGKYFEKRFDTTDYLDVVTSDPDYSYAGDYMVAVRSDRPIGLRFTSYVDEEMLADLLAQFEGTVTYGTVIVPSSAVATMNEITRPELALRGIEYLDVRTDTFFSTDYFDENGEDLGYDFTGVFAGSIVGLSEKNLSRDFSAVGYVEIALATGGSIVIYTEEMNANLKTLAGMYLDEMDEIPADIKTVLDAFAIGRYPQGYDDGLRNDVAK